MPNGDREPLRMSSVGCRHYRRRCKIVSPCCGQVYWCRHCHNEAASSSSWPHEINRAQIVEVICQLCNHQQKPAQSCDACGHDFSSYYCQQCNFWDDDGIRKQVFHCDKCGICRVGGRDNYFHCDACGSCYPAEIKDSHTCVENAMRRNCPVCLQDLFQSVTQVTILQCGHTIHQDCLRELQMSFAGLQSLRCPICSVSLYGCDDLWHEIDRQIEETPMPFEYRQQIKISCNDCQQPSSVEFHILGQKCLACRSYNTRRV
ncbi:unnamed protein product [Durusdinium trenchii]|uniref:E3 ubiquitin-protein ligase MIEL1 (MYB30-interacting E3 ligase 1) (Pirh2-like protein 1) (AtPILP1) (RING-type E3 ubiquitin transferase MIEL1) n=2 Tax=Durusdinium trenchii TaxID=1381693 RepID=A0ABP0MED8_9DINO